jgi:hypothetical protein
MLLKIPFAQARINTAGNALQEAVQSAILEGPQALVQLPSGEQVPVRLLVVPPIKGRKIVLLGDTCDSSAILSVPLPSQPTCLSYSPHDPQ